MTSLPAASSQQIEAGAARRERPRRAVHGLPVLLFSLFVFGTFVVVGILSATIAPHDPGKQALIERLRPPFWQSGGSWDHPLGTDNLGRDELSRLIAGTRVSLIVVASAIPASMVIGSAIGLLAGWRRGFADRALMRVVDVQLALPAILFAVLIAAAFGPSLRNVIVIIVIWSWAGYARLVRGEVLSLRERDFVTAARALGASDLRIIVRHLLPNVLNTIVVLATLDIATVILAEASLSFLGVGVPVTEPSWGGMVSQGRNYISTAWWLITVPGIAILLVSLAGNLAGDWLRDALEPRLRNVR